MTDQQIINLDDKKICLKRDGEYCIYETSCRDLELTDVSRVLNFLLEVLSRNIRPTGCSGSNTGYEITPLATHDGWIVGEHLDSESSELGKESGSSDSDTELEVEQRKYMGRIKSLKAKKAVRKARISSDVNLVKKNRVINEGGVWSCKHHSHDASHGGTVCSCQSDGSHEGTVCSCQSDLQEASVPDWFSWLKNYLTGEKPPVE